MRLLPTVLAALGCTLALPAAANAAYTLGQHPDGVMEGSSTPCPAGCTLVQDRNANAEMRVPEQGVVVKWFVRGRDGRARLQRLAVAGSSATALAATERVSLTGGVQEVPASLPVHAGDAIGLQLDAGAQVDSVDLGFGESLLAWSPALADGATGAGSATTGTAIAFAAVIEPDADGDGLGDESQDACVACSPGGGTPPPPDPPGEPTPPPAEEDPYAAIRTGGPTATIARAATRKGRRVAVTVSNPYAFELKGKLRLERGRKVVAKARLELAANATRTVKLKLRRPARRLTALATLRAAVGAARTTTAKVRVTKPKPGKGGIDGNYRGSGAGADWVMVIERGVVTHFNGSITIYCTKAGEQQSHSFAMVGDDPDPRVAADGTFAWEATSGYGFDKLKFDGRVAGGTITGKMMVESRPLIQGVSPVSGLPRLEAEYCFAGRDYTLERD